MENKKNDATEETNNYADIVKCVIVSLKSTCVLGNVHGKKMSRKREKKNNAYSINSNVGIC